jgi:hypothetical protein
MYLVGHEKIDRLLFETYGTLLYKLFTLNVAIFFL